MLDFNYCALKLEQISELVDGIGRATGYHDPRQQSFQITCTFMYPIGARLTIDEIYSQIQEKLGADWRIKLAAEPAGEKGTLARISALFKNGRADR